MGGEEADYCTRICSDLRDIGPQRWNALACAPGAARPPAFLSFAFLDALARTGCVGRGTGWDPRHLTLWQGDRLCGAVPLYRKSHSYGEYVFDWAWADAYQRHGLRYYPKLLAAIPFTPVGGPRLLAVDAPARAALVAALLDHARTSRMSSLHVLFPPPDEAQALADAGMMVRRGVQFHWHNRDYRSFDDFLAALTQPKRKKIRAERRRIAETGLRFERRIGTEIEERHWAFFSDCYEATYVAHHSTPYLNRAFFQAIGQNMPEHLVMILALDGARPVAASLLVRDDDRLYGRYWGAVDAVPFLHFETAYYQAIETAIELRIPIIEGGAQGEHKMARGFLPQETVSCHWLAEPAFADAVERFLQREGGMIDGYLDELTERSPLRRSDRG